MTIPATTVRWEVLALDRDGHIIDQQSFTSETMARMHNSAPGMRRLLGRAVHRTQLVCCTTFWKKIQ